MIFEIDKSITESDVDSILLFSECLLRACEKGHCVTMDYQVQYWIDSTILNNSAYLGDYSRQILKEVKEFWDPTSMQRAYLRKVVVGNREGVLTIENMALLVEEPSEVVLENGRYDWAVIKKWASLYKRDRSMGSIFLMVHHSIDNHLLREHNAGGCSNIENVVTVLMPIYGNLYNLRLTTIFDSDKKSKFDSVDHHATLKSFLQEKAVEYHELQKGEIENYFPPSVYAKASFLTQSFDLDNSELDWDYVDVYNHDVCPFIQMKKSDVEQLCECLTRDELESRVGDGENEVKKVLIHLAKYI